MKIKICGMKDKKNVEELCALDIDYLGLIFAPSKRQVDVKAAKELSTIIHHYNKKVIGVFVDESDEFILDVIKKVGLDGVQIYKLISKTLQKKIKTLNLELWQVVSVDEKLNLPKELNADLVLFDTKGFYKGGNGISFNWNLLKTYNEKFILAGGIGLENVALACEFNPFIIDINSKVENEKGLKDKELIEKIIFEVKK